MTPFDQFALVAGLGGVALMAGAIYSDYKVKYYTRKLDELRARREAAE